MLGRRSALIRQFILFIFSADGWHQEKASALLKQMDFSNREKIEAVLPFLGAATPSFLPEPVIDDLLTSVDRRHDGVPNFSAYLPVLKESQPESRCALVRYMLRVSPTTAKAFLKENGVPVDE